MKVATMMIFQKIEIELVVQAVSYAVVLGASKARLSLEILISQVSIIIIHLQVELLLTCQI